MSINASLGNGSYELSFNEFAALKLGVINSFQDKQFKDAAKAQLAFLLTKASENGLREKNDWSRQKVPLLDGGGELMLVWEQENGNINNPGAINVDASHPSVQIVESINESASQYTNYPSGGISSQRGSVQNGSYESRGSTNNADAMSMDVRSPIPITKEPGRYSASTQAADTFQTRPYGASNGKRDADDDFASNERKRQRAERFQATNFSSSAQPVPKTEQNDGPIVGLNTNLEKSYLRLTSEPDPWKVRPQHVLEKSVDYVLRKYESLQGKEAFNYLNDQFKSIRQDLTVQHIKNDFTISVYEKNAQLSLKHNDLGEFNQCLGQLKFLYSYKRLSSPDWQKRFISREVEMICYRIIYMMVTNNNSEICKIKLGLLQDYKGFRRQDTNEIYFNFIASLFKLNAYKITNNCVQFYEELDKYKGFKDIELALKVIASFLDQKVRLSGLFIICSSNRPGMKMESLLKMLSFHDMNDCEVFLRQLQLDTFATKGEFHAFKAKGTVKALYKRSAKVDIKGQI